MKPRAESSFKKERIFNWNDGGGGVVGEYETLLCLDSGLIAELKTSLVARQCFMKHTVFCSPA